MNKILNNMIIGIMGKIGSGKSKCLKIIKELYSDYDICVYSCDDIAKELLREDDGKFTFKYLSPYDFFTDERVQEEVRDNFHPLVFNKIKETIGTQSKDSINLVETALPSELFFEMCDKTIYIDSKCENRLNRLKNTRSYTDNQFAVINNSQKYYEKYYNSANYIIDNNGDLDSLKFKIKEVMDEICIICK